MNLRLSGILAGEADVVRTLLPLLDVAVMDGDGKEVHLSPAWNNMGAILLQYVPSTVLFEYLLQRSAEAAVDPSRMDNFLLRDLRAKGLSRMVAVLLRDPRVAAMDRAMAVRGQKRTGVAWDEACRYSASQH
ncbi:hypothetical protein GGF32_004730 [Allomyces javanicus]|nr:hypothetical protein GGF32_004730 [Allomyces javanicus]